MVLPHREGFTSSGPSLHSTSIYKLIYIEEEPFETLDIVEVAMNNDNLFLERWKKT